MRAGTAGVDALVAELSAKEDGNFRLFGYVGQVNAAIEQLRARMREVAAELERWQSSNAAQDTEHARALQVPLPFLLLLAFLILTRICE